MQINGLLEDPRVSLKKHLEALYLEVEAKLRMFNTAARIKTRLENDVITARKKYSAVDRRLAFLDGRLKVLRPKLTVGRKKNSSGKKDLQKILKKMSAETKAKLLEELLKEV